MRTFLGLATRRLATSRWATTAFAAGAATALAFPPAAVASELLVSASVSDTTLTVEALARELGPGGNREVGLEGLRTLAASPSTNEATLWAQLLAVAGRVEPSAAPVAVRAVGLAVGGRGEQGAAAIMEALPTVAPDDRPTLLGLAALLAERTDPLLAADLRERFLAEYSEAPEMPELALRHARWLVSMDSRHEEGVRLLEDLIVNLPSHPIAPEARRIYQLERGGA